MNKESPEPKFAFAAKEDDSWENLSLSEYELIKKEDETAESEIDENVDINTENTIVMADGRQNTIASSLNVLLNFQKIYARYVRKEDEIAELRQDGNVYTREGHAITMREGRQNSILSSPNILPNFQKIWARDVRKKDERDESEMDENVDIYTGEGHSIVTTDGRQNTPVSSPNILLNFQKIYARDVKKENEIAELEMNGNVDIYTEVHTIVMTDGRQNIIASSPYILSNFQKICARDVGKEDDIAYLEMDGNLDIDTGVDTVVMTDGRQNTIASFPNILSNFLEIYARFSKGELEIAELEMDGNVGIYTINKHAIVMTDYNQNTTASSPVLLNFQKIVARNVSQNTEILINAGGKVAKIIFNTQTSRRKNQIHVKLLQRKKLMSSTERKGMMYHLSVVGGVLVAVSYLVFQLTSYNLGWCKDLINHGLHNHSLGNYSGLYLDFLQF